MTDWCDDAYDRAEAQVIDPLSYDGTTDYDWCPDDPDTVLVELQDALTRLQHSMDDRYALLHDAVAMFGGAA